MKLSEFEERLATVSEKKLRLMLAEGRRNGPEVAVNLILAEAARRGVDLEGGDLSSEPADVPLEGFETSPSREDGSGGFEDASEDGGGPDAAEAAVSDDEAPRSYEPDGQPDGEDGPANKGAWLAEETSGGGMSGMSKALIALIVLAGAAGAVYWFAFRG
jgi:hypothetical protein